jgi:chromosome condensin MukBEF ATPase and DNA-binding subunit MukB
MSVLLNKSELNLNAAQYLCKEGHFATVCHPAYYSCLQLMKFKVQDKLKIDYKQQASEASRSYKGNSHGYLISKVKEEISRKKGIQAAKEFMKEMNELKILRERSDYEDIQINRTMCEQAINIAINLRLTINKAL